MTVCDRGKGVRNHQKYRDIFMDGPYLQSFSSVSWKPCECIETDGRTDRQTDRQSFLLQVWAANIIFGVIRVDLRYIEMCLRHCKVKLNAFFQEGSHFSKGFIFGCFPEKCNCCLAVELLFSFKLSEINPSHLLILSKTTAPGGRPLSIFTLRDRCKLAHRLIIGALTIGSRVLNWIYIK